MGDSLNREVWRCVRPGGSLRNELVADVNSARAHGIAMWERHVLLDAIDELIADGSLKENAAGRLYRTGENFTEESADLPAIEHRLDMAWPVTGGHREIVRALAEEVDEMLREARLHGRDTRV